MIPKPKLKLFLSTFCLSVILFPNAYECCSGGGDEKGTTEAPVAGTTEAPAAGTTVTIGMISRQFKSSGSQA